MFLFQRIQVENLQMRCYIVVCLLAASAYAESSQSSGYRYDQGSHGSGPSGVITIGVTSSGPSGSSLSSYGHGGSGIGSSSYSGNGIGSSSFGGSGIGSSGLSISSLGSSGHGGSGISSSGLGGSGIGSSSLGGSGIGSSGFGSSSLGSSGHGGSGIGSSSLGGSSLGSSGLGGSSIGSTSFGGSSGSGSHSSSSEISSGLGSSSSISGIGASILSSAGFSGQSNQPQQHRPKHRVIQEPPEVQFVKEFYTFEAPHEEYHEDESVQRVKESLKKNLQVVFIKTPEVRTVERTALSLAKTASETNTAIYVLQKQPDVSEFSNQLNLIHTHNAHKPEVHFVKYRTPEEAVTAQHTIQSRYETLGGSSVHKHGGVPEILNFASKYAPAYKDHEVVSGGTHDVSGDDDDDSDSSGGSISSGSGSSVSSPSQTYLPAKTK